MVSQKGCEQGQDKILYLKDHWAEAGIPLLKFLAIAQHEREGAWFVTVDVGERRGRGGGGFRDI